MKRTVDKEQYFTGAEEAERCVSLVKKWYPFETFSSIVEPSAGGGAFLPYLPETKTVALDVEPRHPQVAEADFLSWIAPPTSGQRLVIGNPPFGRRGALATKFLYKACLVGDVVAFILPQSFNKYTFINRVHPFFHIVDHMNCESVYSSPNGERHFVKTVFQIWEKRDDKRTQIVFRDTHPDFTMKHCHLSRVSENDLMVLRKEYKFAIPQVGSSFKPQDVNRVTKGSHWFIKPHVPGVRRRFEKLDFSFLDGMNTAHKSLSKRDIIKAYETVATKNATISGKDRGNAVGDKS